MRNYILNLLTQTSTWLGIIILLEALLLPRSILMFTGVLFILFDDAKLQSTFNKIRQFLASKWPQE